MLGSLISAGASIVGGILGSNAAKDAAHENAAMQKMFAKHGIQWKTQDAIKAGIHPLYALGAPTIGFQPSFVGDNSLGEGIAQAGQDIGRAVAANSSTNQRLDQFSKLAQLLTLEKGGLENDLLRSKIRVLNQAGGIPPKPTMAEAQVLPGQGDSRVAVGPGWKAVTNPVDSSVGQGIAAGVGPTTQHFVTPDGIYVNAPAPGYKQAIEDDEFMEASQAVRLGVMPNLGSRATMPRLKPPPGHKWQWSFENQGWVLIKREQPMDNAVRRYRSTQSWIPRFYYDDGY